MILTNIFVQCRLNSSRFPKKILSKINNRSLIEILGKRLLNCKKINKIVFLSPLSDKGYLNNKKIKLPNINFFYGDETNVLDRFFQASLKYKSDYIVRLTADCPLIDPTMLDFMVKINNKKKFDYFSNVDPSTFPDGFDIEIFSSKILEHVASMKNLKLDKEHVTYSMRNNLQIKKGNLYYPKDLSTYRATIDYSNDLQILKKISQKINLEKVNFFQTSNFLIKENNQKNYRNEKLMTSKTKNMWLKSNELIPDGNSLLSKNPKIYDLENWPSHYKYAKGIKIKDLDNKQYYDFSNMGVGTNILGYNNKKINTFVKSKIDKSSMSSLNCPEEVFLAKKMIELHPWSQKALFARTGAEANSIAIRLARSFNKRNIILICGYHGWNDWYLSANFLNKKNLNNHLFSGLKINGVDKNLKNSTKTFNFNDLKSLKKIVKKYDKRISAVIMEVKRDHNPNKNFLNYIKTQCQRRNIVLIFDECTSGFRESFGGIHLNYGINPDMAMFGKALGNGFAINVLIGKSKIMDQKINSFISSTFWTERLGPSAGLKTLEEMKRLKSWKIITHKGKYLRNKIANLTKKNIYVSLNKEGIIPNLKLNFLNNSLKKIYINFMLKKGILASDRIYLSVEHKKEQLDFFLKNFKLFLNTINKNYFIYK